MKDKQRGMELKDKIEQVRGELGKAIEHKEAPDKIMSLSVKLDGLIEQYLEVCRKSENS